MKWGLKKMSENPNGLEIKRCACCSQKWLSPQQWGREKKRTEKKRFNNGEPPLSVLLPANVAVQWVIFITNEINNAAICSQLSPGVVHQLREMRILRYTNRKTLGERVKQNMPHTRHTNEYHTGKCLKIPEYKYTCIQKQWHINRSIKKQTHVIINVQLQLSV